MSDSDRQPLQVQVPRYFEYFVMLVVVLLAWGGELGGRFRLRVVPRGRCEPSVFGLPVGVVAGFRAAGLSRYLGCVPG